MRKAQNICRWHNLGRSWLYLGEWSEPMWRSASTTPCILLKATLCKYGKKSYAFINIHHLNYCLNNCLKSIVSSPQFPAQQRSEWEVILWDRLCCRLKMFYFYIEYLNPRTKVHQSLGIIHTGVEFAAYRYAHAYWSKTRKICIYGQACVSNIKWY